MFRPTENSGVNSGPYFTTPTQCKGEKGTDASCSYQILGQYSDTMSVHSRSGLQASPGKTEKEASRLRDQFVCSSELEILDKDQKEQVFSKCLESYQEAVIHFESSLANLLFDHPKAKGFASEMCRRMECIIDAYNQTVVEDDTSASQSCVEDDAFASPSLPSSVMSELKQKIFFAKAFATPASGAGGVGSNLIRIRQAIKEGNLREQMTLIYATIFSTFLNDVLKDRASIDRVNIKLQAMNAGFQLDVDAIEEDRRKDGKLLKTSERVTKFRTDEKGRVAKPAVKPHNDTIGPQLSEISGLTLREAQSATEDYDLKQEDLEAIKAGSKDKKIEKIAQRRVKWISGLESWIVGAETTYAKEAKSLGLPLSVMIAGPSGTTDGFLHATKYIGMEDQVEEGTLACIGWMTPARDHSAHEILLAASDYGIPYEGMPGDFERCLDSEVLQQVRDSLEHAGYEMPSYYLSEKHQLRAALELGFDPEKKARQLEEAKRMIDQAVESSRTSTLKSIEMTAKLQEINLQLRKFEDSYLACHKMQESGEYGLISKELNRLGKTIKKQYQALLLVKAAYVKETYPDNPVYAMANPRVLEEGTQFYCAGTTAKMDKLLINQGFAWSETHPATGYAEGFVVSGRWGVNEMGEIGHYFSKDTPAYYGGMGEETNEEGKKTRVSLDHALQCELFDKMNGVSILSITELEKAMKFSRQDIDKGYKQLQKDYPFLQNDGLHPKETEIVFTRTEDKLKPTAVKRKNDYMDETFKIETYYLYERFDLDYEEEENPFKLHASWSPRTPGAPSMQTGVGVDDLPSLEETGEKIEVKN